MTKRFQFGLVVRGQAEEGEDISRRFQETMALVRMADRLGFDSVTKTAHYSARPFQMLQMVPMLARVKSRLACGCCASAGNCSFRSCIFCTSEAMEISLLSLYPWLRIASRKRCSSMLSAFSAGAALAGLAC